MDNLISKQILKDVSVNQNISIDKVKVVLDLIEEGNTVPFIARYRKEQTGALDEDQIRDIFKEWEYETNLAKRKEDVIRLIDEKGLLTAELKDKIIKAPKLVDVEDIYRPFKEKKKTKATDAINNGLEGLAKLIMSQPTKGDTDSLAAKFINENVKTTEEAITGAKYIIAEWISDNAFYRKAIRGQITRTGSLCTKLKKNAVDENKTYEMYYEYSESIAKAKAHRILAINRAEKEKVISVSIDVDKDNITSYLESKMIKSNESFTIDYIKEAIKDSFKRLIFPSISREIRSELTTNSEEKSIDLFGINLKNLLLQPPIQNKVVLGVDPAYRTGCKLCLLDSTGKVLLKDVIYPHQKNKGEKVPKSRIDDANTKVANIVTKYNVDIIAIGNGTASRETESFIADLLQILNTDTKYVIVNEAGASVYSASKVAQEEFPDYSVEERSAASIGRRLQDPLSELVKIDPKSIGVGQYQHDVNQKNLSEQLDYVVLTSVNSVGVDVNTASKSLLQYVSGLTKATAKKLVEHRNKVGKFNSREEIKKVKGMGSKAFEQAAGFLRIYDGNNPLDITSIHPESYSIAEQIVKDYSLDRTHFGKKDTKDKLKDVKYSELATKYDTDKYTVEEIIKSFISPIRDPRDSFEKPVLRSDVLHIEDLKLGMELSGTVRNVVDFGVFIDIGLKNDGLCHISRLSASFVSHPKDIVNLGDIVKVYVHDVDLNKNKVSLSMIKN